MFHNYRISLDIQSTIDKPVTYDEIILQYIVCYSYNVLIFIMDLDITLGEPYMWRHELSQLRVITLHAVQFGLIFLSNFCNTVFSLSLHGT
jgi:hypothetical protein